jgi:hypothetical protein
MKVSSSFAWPIPGPSERPLWCVGQVCPSGHFESQLAKMPYVALCLLTLRWAFGDPVKRKLSWRHTGFGFSGEGLCGVLTFSCCLSFWSWGSSQDSSCPLSCRCRVGHGDENIATQPGSTGIWAERKWGCKCTQAEVNLWNVLAMLWCMKF